MKAFFQKLSGYFLLLTGCIPLAFALFFLAKQQAIRHEMKEKLEEPLLHTLTVAANDVRWIKNKKEIWVSGKMFDVKFWSVKNGQYKFTGLFDEEETALVRQLNNNTRKGNEPGSRLLVQLFQWLQSAYPNNNIPLLSAGDPAELTYYFIPRGLSAPFKAILTPPPQS